MYCKTASRIWIKMSFDLKKEPDLAGINQREALNHAKAEERFRDALKELKSQRLKDSEMQSRWALFNFWMWLAGWMDITPKQREKCSHCFYLLSSTINARKKALQVEKERSSKVANLPPPPSNPILVSCPVVLKGCGWNGVKIEQIQDCHDKKKRLIHIITKLWKKCAQSERELNIV